MRAAGIAAAPFLAEIKKDLGIEGKDKAMKNGHSQALSQKVSRIAKLVRWNTTVACLCSLAACGGGTSSDAGPVATSAAVSLAPASGSSSNSTGSLANNPTSIAAGTANASDTGTSVSRPNTPEPTSTVIQSESPTDPDLAPNAAAQAQPVELITAGSLKWYFMAEPPADKKQQITDSMNFAVNNVNTVANFQGNVGVLYDASVSTASASFNTRIRFGGMMGPGVAQHELGHWLGAISFDSNPNVVDQNYVGPLGASRIQAYDGASAVLHVDTQHFSPYGWNYSREYVSPQREIGIVSAIRGDKGLSDGMTLLSGHYRIQNRLSGGLLGSLTGAVAGATVKQRLNVPGDERAWAVTSLNGFVTLANLSNGLFIDGLGSTVDGTAVKQSTASAPNAATKDQQWEIVPTDAGYFNLVNRATGKCLGNGGNSQIGSDMLLASCQGTSVSTQWHFVR